VVNVTERPEPFFFLNRGKWTFGPLRLPDLESRHASRPRTRLRIPAAYASFEFCAHHGATSPFARFHALRNDGNVQPTAGVSWSPVRP
jgi:hypothetical protein